MKFPCIISWVVLAALVSTVVASEPEPFEFVDGDRVVLLGNTLIERSQSNGYIETALTARYPNRNIIFRNLGWSGDTVYGDSRERFGTLSTDAGWSPPAVDKFRKITEGFRHLNFYAHFTKPTVILLGYGANASHRGPDGLEHFLTGLDRLLFTLADTNARIVLLSPLRHENMGAPLPDPTAHNADVRLYSDALRKEAEKRGLYYVDLYDLLGRPDSTVGSGKYPHDQLTDNGIHLTDYGYWRAAPALERGLGLTADRWLVDFDVRANSLDTLGATVSDVVVGSVMDNGSGTFTVADRRLPRNVAPRFSPAKGRHAAAADRVLRVRGLAPGKYRLSIDSKEVITAAASDWDAGVKLTTGPEFEQAEQLRSVIREKNTLFFNRFRPENETYLFLFRKHEQGNNAVEIPQFDPFIKEKEEQIATLRVPQPHTYRLEKISQ